MGRTCGEPDEIELTPMGVELNGSGRVQGLADGVPAWGEVRRGTPHRGEILGPDALAEGCGVADGVQAFLADVEAGEDTFVERGRGLDEFAATQDAEGVGARRVLPVTKGSGRVCRVGGWVVVLDPASSPHVRPMGGTCR